MTAKNTLHGNPVGKVIDFPMCGEWECDYEDHWYCVDPSHREYQAAKREDQIVRYHQPRSGWRVKLQRERDDQNDGQPLWIVTV